MQHHVRCRTSCNFLGTLRVKLDFEVQLPHRGRTCKEKFRQIVDSRHMRYPHVRLSGGRYLRTWCGIGNYQLRLQYMYNGGPSASSGCKQVLVHPTPTIPSRSLQRSEVSLRLGKAVSIRASMHKYDSHTIETTLLRPRTATQSY